MNPLGRLRRARRWVADLRPPQRTALRWVRRGPAGSVHFGVPGTAVHEQPEGRVRLGEDVRIADQVQFVLGPEGRVEIGDRAVVAANVVIAADRQVTIGADCRIGRYATVVDTWSYGHAADHAPPPEPVEVGDGATVGPHVVLGPGVRVEAGRSVDAGTVVHAEGPA